MFACVHCAMHSVFFLQKTDRRETARSFSHPQKTVNCTTKGVVCVMKIDKMYRLFESIVFAWNRIVYFESLYP